MATRQADAEPIERRVTSQPLAWKVECRVIEQGALYRRHISIQLNDVPIFVTNAHDRECPDELALRIGIQEFASLMQRLAFAEERGLITENAALDLATRTADE